MEDSTGTVLLESTYGDIFMEQISGQCVLNPTLLASIITKQHLVISLDGHGFWSVLDRWLV